MTKEEANQVLTELVTNINLQLVEAEKLATEHHLEFSISSPHLSEQSDGPIRFVAEHHREVYKDGEVEEWDRVGYIGGWNSSSCW